jgi:hypothetical protein
MDPDQIARQVELLGASRIGMVITDVDAGRAAPVTDLPRDVPEDGWVLRVLRNPALAPASAMFRRGSDAPAASTAPAHRRVSTSTCGWRCVTGR